MGMHDGHRDRLRNQFIKHGLAGFEEHTVLELLLFYARPRCDTNEIAHALIDRFGSFAAVLDAPLEELEAVPGIGHNSAVLLKMVPELGAYYLQSHAQPGQIIDSTAKAGAFFLPIFLGKRNEEAWLVALDDRRKVQRCVCLAKEGIVNAVRITTKRIVTEAVNANATGIILAHNHPGGIALPSSGDKKVTRQALHALKLINVQLVDHIVVAGNDFVSMADSGYLDMMEQQDVP